MEPLPAHRRRPAAALSWARPAPPEPARAGRTFFARTLAAATRRHAHVRGVAAGNLTTMKIVLKDSLKAVPGFGWATQVGHGARGAGCGTVRVARARAHYGGSLRGRGLAPLQAVRTRAGA